MNAAEYRREAERAINPAVGSGAHPGQPARGDRVQLTTTITALGTTHHPGERGVIEAWEVGQPYILRMDDGRPQFADRHEFTILATGPDYRATEIETRQILGAIRTPRRLTPRKDSYPMATLDHINAAIRILDKDGFSNLSVQKANESAGHARVALALAVHDLAQAAKAEARPVHPTTTNWPEGVTARFVTRYGTRFNHPNATVNIHDDANHPHARSRATCHPCGWTRDHGLTYRFEVLTWAQAHADQCTAAPQPDA